MTEIKCPRCGDTYHTVSPRYMAICPYCELSHAEVIKEYSRIREEEKKEKEFRRKIDLWNRITYYLMPQGIFRRKK